MRAEDHVKLNKILTNSYKITKDIQNHEATGIVLTILCATKECMSNY